MAISNTLEIIHNSSYTAHISVIFICAIYHIRIIATARPVREQIIPPIEKFVDQSHPFSKVWTTPCLREELEKACKRKRITRCDAGQNAVAGTHGSRAQHVDRCSGGGGLSRNSSSDCAGSPPKDFLIGDRSYSAMKEHTRRPHYWRYYHLGHTTEMRAFLIEIIAGLIRENPCPRSRLEERLRGRPPIHSIKKMDFICILMVAFHKTYRGYGELATCPEDSVELERGSRWTLP